MWERDGAAMKRNESEGIDQLTAVSVAKRQWEKTFDAISDPLMIVDGDYVIRRANLALADDLGVAIQRVVGRRCHEVRAEAAQAFTGEAGSPCSGCPVPQARREGAPRDSDMQARSGRVYRLRAYPLEETRPRVPDSAQTPEPVRMDGAAPLIVCSYRDVTDEREMTRQLSNAEKLAAIGRLAGGVAHEINNPLGGILAFSQILLRERCPPEEQLEYLKEIEKSAFRCKAIVEALLRFARQSPRMKRAALALNDVVRESLTLVSYKYSVRDVQIRCQLRDDLPPVMGNANQLEQVLVNLLSNAFDAITSGAGHPGGAIDLVTTTSPDGWVELQVADSGSGISDAHLAKIFDPFFTTKEEGKGTGLGLAVTYAIIREHGGRIAARNRSGGGAVFTVALPVADPTYG
jgi:two-component system NtrC family sensor kinase